MDFISASVLASTINAESAGSSVGAVGGFVALITTLSGSQLGNEFGLALDLVSGTSVLAGAINTEAAGTGIGTVS